MHDILFDVAILIMLAILTTYLRIRHEIATEEQECVSEPEEEQEP
jgi:hypothetical protein